MTSPTLAEQVEGVGRMYRDPETDDLYPSVTSIIDALDKPALVGWAAKETAKAAWKNRHALLNLEDQEAAIDLLKNSRYRSNERKAKIGTIVHGIAEALAKDAPLPTFDETHAPYADQFMRFVDDFDATFELVERSVINRTYGFAGTFDTVLRLGGSGRVLADYKTGSGIYSEVALQLAGLRNGELVWDEDTGALAPMPAVEGCIAVWLQRDFYKVFSIDAGDKAYRAFLALRDLWPWNKGGDSKRVVSPAMSPQRLAAVLGGDLVAAGKRKP